MDTSKVSHQSENCLDNSATITVDTTLAGDNFRLIPEGADFKGSFAVTSSSNESVDNVNCVYSAGKEFDKSSTLAVCHPTLNSEEENIKDDAILKDQIGELSEVKNAQKTKPLVVQSVDELATIDEENIVVNCDDIVIIATDQEVDVDSANESPETISDCKQITKPRASEKRNSLTNNTITSRGIPCYPVIELEEVVGENESTKRNNKVEYGHRRASDTFSPATSIKAGTVAVPVESSEECRHSTRQVVSKNKSPLSLENPAKGTQSGRIDTQTTPIKHKENRLPAIINTDDRTSDNKKCKRRNSSERTTNVNVANIGVNRTRCHSSHGERVRGTNTKLPYRNKAISRSYDKSVNILGSENSLVSSGERQRPVSVFEQRYTIRELRRALPRRSFFSCHEKAMKDAGLETDDPEKKRKAERLQARLERIANEFSPLPSSRNKPNIHESHSLVNGAAVNITINEGNEFAHNTAHNENTIEECDSLISNMNSDLAPDRDDTLSGATSSKQDATKLLLKPTHKKRPGSARQEHIDCKPLLQYLEYVKDNREEYLHHNHMHSSRSTKPNPSSRLISLGKAFELRHLGGIPRRQDDDIVVMAAKALRPRCSDSAKYTKIERDRSGTHRGQDALRQTRPSSEDKRKQEPHTKEEEHAKTELEKKRIRAEEWTKSVSTNTLTRAKIQSLRELGADDVEVMKWWDAFKSCRYLRDTGPVEEKAC